MPATEVCRLVQAYSNLIGLTLAGAAELVDDGVHERFRVPKKHQRLVEVVKRIVYASEGWSPSAIAQHDRSRFIDVKNRHAVNWAAGVSASRRIGDVIRSNHQRHVRLREFAVNFIQ